MSSPVAPEPPDAMPPEAGRPATPPSPRAGLDSVPAFLRDRLGELAAASSPTLRPAPAAPEGPLPDPSSLPMLGIAPRKLATVGAAVVLAWLLISFGRQVAEATATSARADDLRSQNAALAIEVEALQEELQTIQEQRFIDQAARAYRLGSPNEIPFALEADAPPLPADAPGSAAARLGAPTAERSPLDTWLEVLFGPSS